MHRYIKVPLLFGLPQVLFYLIRYWPDWHQSIIGFLIGAFAGFIIVVMHDGYVRQAAKNISDDSFKLHQKRTVLLHVPYERAFDLCAESVIDLKRGRIKEEDRANGKIKARTVGSMKTWGCAISFEINKVGDLLTRIEISSRPVMPVTAVDYGENLEHVEKISNFLFQHDVHLDIKALDSKLTAFINPELDKRNNQTIPQNNDTTSNN